MLNIYAASFLTATRTDGVRLRELPSATKAEKRRWFRRPPQGPVEIEKL